MRVARKPEAFGERGSQVSRSSRARPTRVTKTQPTRSVRSRTPRTGGRCTVCPPGEDWLSRRCVDSPGGHGTARDVKRRGHRPGDVFPPSPMAVSTAWRPPQTRGRSWRSRPDRGRTSRPLLDRRADTPDADSRILTRERLVETSIAGGDRKPGAADRASGPASGTPILRRPVCGSLPAPRSSRRRPLPGITEPRLGTCTTCRRWQISVRSMPRHEKQCDKVLGRRLIAKRYRASVASSRPNGAQVDPALSRLSIADWSMRRLDGQPHPKTSRLERSREIVAQCG
jgi:hypothetical protein